MTNSAADPVLLARDLLRCRTVTPAEGGALSLIEATLRSAGFTVHRMTFEEPGTAPVENLYARIGTRTSDNRGLRTYETEAAAAAGLRARRQLLSTTRHGHGT